jgi:ElaA protein
MNYELKKFEDLSTIELYRLLQLRSDVFIVEQYCNYRDLDDKDLKAYHLLGYHEGIMVSYARLLDKGISYPSDCSIGRVLTHGSIRKTRAGMELMQKAIAYCRDLFPNLAIHISAQTYLLKFYSDLGFVSTGNEYMEDEIPHTEMIMK